MRVSYGLMGGGYGEKSERTLTTEYLSEAFSYRPAIGTRRGLL
jgi:hypothetical protein